MPWCESCEKNWTPTSLNEDGTCPRCGEPVDSPVVGDHGPSEEAAIDHRIPWHFWVGVVAISIYLVWRLIQMTLWLF